MGKWISAILGLFLIAQGIRAELRLGIEPRVSTAETLQAFNPLAEYLAAEIGEPVRIVVPESFASFGMALEQRQYDLAFAAPATVLRHTAAFADQLHRLGVAVDRGQGTRLRGVVVVQKNSLPQRIDDPKGRRVAFVDKRSQGYLVLSQRMRDAGVDPEHDIRAEFHRRLDLTVQALLDDKVDAAGVGDVNFTKLKDKADLSQVRTIATSPPLPNWTMVGFDRQVSAEVAGALTALRPDSVTAEKVLGAIPVSAFQEPDTSELALLKRTLHARAGD